MYSATSRNINNIVQPLLTDKYQISMCYAYWRDSKHLDEAVFDLFFRKNPFKGEFTIFAGLHECLKFLANFQFTECDIKYLMGLADYKHIDQEFWNYLTELNGKSVKLYALEEGSVCFPNLPLIRVEGPLGFIQLIETTLLNLINYASLVATNATRYRMAANSGAANNCKLLEFGLRRSQGPDGGLSASRYAYMGGFDATSNLLAGKEFEIPVSGTLGHAFIMSYYGTSEFQKDGEEDHKFLINRITGESENFTKHCLSVEREFVSNYHLYKNRDSQAVEVRKSEQSELRAFISFAWAFPDTFLALVDTYDVIKSGLNNFCVVAIALLRFGYKPLGIRIDSGDLAYLSRYARDLFVAIASVYNLDQFLAFDIVASNDINEETLISLSDQSHGITCMAVGTHLVTCQSQPALGCVYKLVEANGIPCMKLSSMPEKVTIPCKKAAYRLFGNGGHALIDLIQMHDEPKPQAGARIICRHPFIAERRTYVTPSRVEPILNLWWDGKIVKQPPSLAEVRSHCIRSLDYLTGDIKRYLNPTPYKVSVSEKLYDLLNHLRLSLTPIGELS